MKRSLFFPLALASLMLGQSANAQTVATDPVGFVQPFATSPNMLANSDTQVAVPFTRPPEFVGATASATANTLTVSGTPWTANQFVYVAGSQPKTYFVLIGPHASTNPKEGRIYQITGNTTNQLTLAVGGDNVSGVAASTQVLVIPAHTIGSVFPASDVNVSFLASPTTFNRPTQILLPDNSGTGINLSAGATYFFFNSHWRTTLDSSGNHDDDPLPLTSYFTVRNAGTGTTLTTLGSVLTKKVSVPLLTKIGGQVDNFVSAPRPVDVKLDDLDLVSSGAFRESPTTFNRIDQLLVFNPAAVAQNKSAAATYFYLTGSGWRSTLDSNPHGTDVIPAGSGFVIRKGATVDGAPAYWTNSPRY